MSIPTETPLHGYQESGDESIVLFKSGNVTYVASAPPSSLTSEAVWKVFRYDNSTLRLQYADGNQKYDNLATDLATVAALTYV